MFLNSSTEREQWDIAWVQPCLLFLSLLFQPWDGCVLAHWTIAHKQDYFLHGQHWKGNRTQQMRGSLGWESRGVNAAQPELSAKLPGQGMGRAQMLTWPCMQTLLFCHHLTPARWLKRGRVFPYGGPPAFRTVLAVFAALERSQDTNTDAGELCTLVAAGETRPGKSVLGTVPWSLLSLVIFIQGSNALLQWQTWEDILH